MWNWNPTCLTAKDSFFTCLITGIAGNEHDVLDFAGHLQGYSENRRSGS